MTVEACWQGRSGTRMGAAVALLAVLAVAAVWCAVAAPSASASKYVDSFFGNPGGSTGTTGGLFDAAGGIAVNDATGAVYAVDRENNRVQQFDPSNEFVRAWGQDVIVDGAPNSNGTGFEICDTTAGNTAADCKAGDSSAVTGGTMSSPRGVAVNQTTGHVYVTDGGFRRVQEFSATGEFVRAFGGDVVAPGGTGETFLPGGVNERQTVTIPISGIGTPVVAGTFTLNLDGQTTDPIAYDAPAAAVDSALEALSNVGAGGVAVTGPNGGPWTIDFIGPLGGTNVPPLVGDPAGLDAGFGPGFLTSVEVATPIQGGPSGAHEICTIQAECQTGANAEFGGAFATTFVGYPAVVPAGAPNAGNVLVADSGNSRVQEFTATGEFVRTFGYDVNSAASGTGFEICTAVADCKSGAPGNASGQFAANEPRRVAADEAGDVYTVEMLTNVRVQKFSGAGLTASPFAASDLVGVPFLAGTDSPTDIAFDSLAGRIIVARSTSYTAAACGFPAQGAERRLLSFSPTGTLHDTSLACAGLGFGDFTYQGLAVRPSTGTVYVSANGYTNSSGLNAAQRVFVIDDDGATPAISELDPATAVTATSAELGGTVNPNSIDNDLEPTAWRLQVSRNGVEWVTVSSGGLPAGTTPQPVEGAATGLRPNSQYRVRLVTNKPFGNPDAASAELSVLTDAVGPEVRTTATQSIAETTAVVSARINPHSTPTSYRFEWGRDGLDRTAPLPDGVVGSGPDFVTVAQQLDGLTPGETYRYRVVATSATEGVTFGPTNTFTARQAAAAGSTAAYELVSPADKVSGVGVGPWYAGPAAHATTGMGAIDGDRFAVMGYYGSVLVDGEYAHGNDWALAQRGTSGWTHKPAFNRRGGYGEAELYRLPYIQGSSSDLSLTAWTTNNSMLKMFPEQESWGNPQGTLIRDWEPGRWEPLGPTDPEIQSRVQSTVGFDQLTVARGGSAVLAAGYIAGLAGAGDPSHPDWGDLVQGNRNVYLDDVSAGLSGTFVGSGQRILANVCTGAGVERTEIPSVDGNGKLVGSPCPAPDSGRSARLISNRGASLTAAQVDGPRNAISADGRRAFFLSPDAANVVINHDPCTGTGDLTTCPPQMYVRQRNADGSVTTRWISESQVDGQNASLASGALFQGATPDGDKVFFHTAAPLTADDPNGGTPVPGGVTTGTADPRSVDLYMYDFPDAPGADPGDGTLTRISAGPTGDADPNVAPDIESPGDRKPTSLRAVSDDGNLVYFVSAAPLPGVADPGNGTITAPGGAPDNKSQRNLYLYDARRDPTERWRFVARLPADTPLGGCATRGYRPSLPGRSADKGAAIGISDPPANCVRVSADGEFMTMWTDGRLTADDDTDTGDVYGYDARADELTRISAPQGGIEEEYECIDKFVQAVCHADLGIGQSSFEELGLVSEPAIEGDRTAFFESASRLVSSDRDSGYDVYKWHNGTLSLVTSGASNSQDALYQGNDRTGRNVYLTTRDRLTWQDHDAVLDVYVSRLGGGIAPPPSPVICEVLGDVCQSSGSGSPAPVADATERDAGSSPGDNERLGARAELSRLALTGAAKRRAVASGVLRLRVDTNAPGTVTARARAKIGKGRKQIGLARQRVRDAGRVVLSLKFSRASRRQLERSGRLRVTVGVTMVGARPRTMTMLLIAPATKRSVEGR